MFCPVCRSEYRQGFIRCNVCNVGLVFALPELQSGERSADQVGQGSFLAWFLPMAAFYLFCLSAFFQVHWLTYPTVLLAVLLMVLIANVGCVWMIDQAIRYEEEVLKYVLYSFVPFLFIWYYQERYRRRKRIGRASLGLR